MPEPTSTAQDPYPIVAERPFAPAQRSGLWGLGPKRRREAELLRPMSGHHVLVYRVNGGYIVDSTGLGARDEEVIRATHVSVVSMRRDAPVTVEFQVPSADADEFVVRVHFGCTVVDPALVVRQGMTDPGQVLRAYVLEYHNALQMGLGFTLSQVNEARRHIHDVLDAYRTVRPPLLDGFEVRLTNVEVQTPAEIAEVQRRRREMANQHLLDRDELHFSFRKRQVAEGNDHLIGLASQEHDQERRLSALEHDHLAARQEQMHRSGLADAEQRDTLRRREGMLDYQIAQVQKVQELMGRDPAVAARFLASLERENGAVELADSLEGRERAAIERQDRRDDAQREAELELERHQREVQASRDSLEAQLRLREAEAEIARKNADAEQARLERERENTMAHIRAEWERADQLELRRAERADAKAQLEAKLAVLRELAQRGHLDMVEMNVDRLVNELSGTEPSLPATPSPQPIEASNTAEKGGTSSHEPGSNDA